MMIKPALTAEEWAEAIPPNGGPAGFLRGLERVTDGRSCHAMAASCLHEQPFGFSREDVKSLRSPWPVLNAHWLGKLDALADRIEALLPPEQP